MPMIYSNPADESNPHKLPDVEVFQMTAQEVALLDEDTCRVYMRRPEFKLASMSSRVLDAMVDAMVAENYITGGWMFHYCFPGCLPESSPFGPYATYQEAVDAVRDMVEA